MDDPRAVGERLREARVLSGLSQRELAFEGCSHAYISRVESGRRTPSLQLLRELGRRLGVSEDYLATGVEVAASPLAEAELLLRLDQAEEAARLYRSVLEAAPDDRTRAAALEGLGQVALRSGEPEEAVRCFEEALTASGEEPWERPALAESLARGCASLGRLGFAISLLESCVEHSGEDLFQYVRFSALLGYALTDNGNFAEAERVVGKALESGHELADPQARARLYWSEFRLRGEQGQSAQAEEYARKALETLRATDDQYAIALVHQALAHICIDLGRPAEALELLEQGRSSISAAATPLELAQYRLEEARALAALGERERASALAVQITGDLGQQHRVDFGRTYVLLAELLHDSGDIARAHELYELAIELLEQRGPSRYLVKAYRRLAELLKAEGKRDEALEILERAVGTQDRAGRMLT